QVIKSEAQGTVTTNYEQHFMEALSAWLGKKKMSSAESLTPLDVDFSAEISQAKIEKVYRELANSGLGTM
ncbi:MAG: hypothetical protein LUQ65_03095, partial [Candidatus Helarchaeota archaeon]|nr:hypothetical protein [Candidatus Helarchaeota archaeon]